MYEQGIATAGYVQADAKITFAGDSPSIVVELAQAADALRCQIDVLSDRLAPVVRPEYDGPQQADNAPRPVVAPIRDVLHKVIGETSRLVALRERLEV